MHRGLDITRRQLAALLLGGVAQAAPARNATLTIGLSISDTITLDPARQNNYSPPLTLAAVYDTLVTLEPSRYAAPAPLLAATWARTPDRLGLRFTLDPAARFSSGAKVTPEDCAFTFERILALGDQSAQFLDNVAAVAASGPDTFDIVLKAPDQPILGLLAAPCFSVLEKQVLLAHGGSAAPDAGRRDRAALWLNQHSAGSGPYMLTGWARNQQIELAANPHAWRGVAAYRRILIRHIQDGAAQFRALKRGEIDVAFNLIPEEIVSLQSEIGIRVESVTSLDFVYLALNADPALNQALAVKQARQAIGCAIDYDGLIGRLLGGKAVRPAHFLPIGVRGSTETIARQIGYNQNLDRARRLLAEAGLASGFEFTLNYADGAIAGLSYAALAHKLRADLSQVGIKVLLESMDPRSLRSRYLGGRAQSVLTFWNAPAIETRLWASAAVERVGPRIGAGADPAMIELVNRAASEPDPAKQQALWIDYQKAMVDAANLIVLFQPIYQVAVRNTVASFPLTAAGWMAELGDARPA